MSTSTHLQRNLITFDPFNFANGDACVHLEKNGIFLFLIHNYDGNLSALKAILERRDSAGIQEY